MKVSIILPTYNESENIISLIEEIFKFMPDSEIIVVDDDSLDETWKVVGDYDNPNVKLIRRTSEKGLATAIKRGLDEAKTAVVGWMDADMSMPPSTLAEMAKAIGECDIAIGSRYAKGGKDTRGILRVLTSRLINWFAGFLLGFDIKDYDSGFILLKKSVFDNVAFPSKGYGDYFIEFIYKCKQADFRIKEIPYSFKDRIKGKSKTTNSILGFARLGIGYISRIVCLRFHK